MKAILQSECGVGYDETQCNRLKGQFLVLKILTAVSISNKSDIPVDNIDVLLFAA